MGIIPDKYITELLKTVRHKWDRSDGKPMNGWLAISPLFVFLFTYLLTSIIAKDFYKVPISAAFLIASVYAIIICRAKTLEQRISIFSDGAGNRNVLLMIWIFVLAGAFASTAKEIGAIEATVNIALHLLPGRFLYAGLFLAACFISMSIGTSVGTIVALVPIAAGISGELTSGSNISAFCETPFITAIIVGGAFFGDNLSFISDTTIAATRTQGCSMADKFKTNIKIVGPAALVVTVLYVVIGSSVSTISEPAPIKWVLLIPYFLVISLSLCGMNVAAVLSIGIFANAIIALSSGSTTWMSLLSSIGSGISGMGDLIIVTMLAGGILEVIKTNGGLNFIVHALSSRIKGRRGAEFSIAGLVSVANFCTANNTIAIISVGNIAKNITEKFGLDPRKTASILDIFSCLVQGMIPYGAQMLMAAGLADVPTLSITGYLYYPFIMGVFAVLSIVLQFPYKKQAA